MDLYRRVSIVVLNQFLRVSRKFENTVTFVKIWVQSLSWDFFPSRSAQNRLATIRLPYAGPTTDLKSTKCRLYERRLLADFRPVVGPAYGSRMVANQIRADRALYFFYSFYQILIRS